MHDLWTIHLRKTKNNWTKKEAKIFQILLFASTVFWLLFYFTQSYLRYWAHPHCRRWAPSVPLRSFAIVIFLALSQYHTSALKQELLSSPLDIWQMFPLLQWPQNIEHTFCMLLANHGPILVNLWHFQYQLQGYDTSNIVCAKRQSISWNKYYLSQHTIYWWTCFLNVTKPFSYDILTEIERAGLSTK